MLVKKVAPILLLVVLLFNLFGYHLFFNYLQLKQQQALLDQLYSVNNYSDYNLKSVKVPVTFPYYTNHKEFEPVSGEIEVSGTYYKMVKKRIYNDSLEIVYMMDVDKIKLENAKNDFVKYVNGETLPLNSKSVKTVKPFTFEFLFSYQVVSNPIKQTVISSYSFPVAEAILTQTSFSIDHPPESITL